MVETVLKPSPLCSLVLNLRRKAESKKVVENKVVEDNLMEYFLEDGSVGVEHCLEPCRHAVRAILRAKIEQ